MQPIVTNASLLAFAIPGAEVFVVLSALLILFGCRRIPDFGRGLRRGISEFLKASDQTGIDAGRSAGGIYGKPAAVALTTDNETVELHDPAVLRNSTSNLQRGSKRGRFPRTAKMLGWLLFVLAVATTVAFVVARIAGNQLLRVGRIAVLITRWRNPGSVLSINPSL